MGVTIRDVAAAGAHPSAVSRAPLRPQLVNAETRQRVIAAARDLKYQPNRAASGLIIGKTRNIGLIAADLANPFFPPLIKAAQANALKSGHHAFVAGTDESPHVEQGLVEALAKQVDGVLLCNPRAVNRQIGRAAFGRGRVTGRGRGAGGGGRVAGGRVDWRAGRSEGAPANGAGGA